MRRGLGCEKSAYEVQYKTSTGARIILALFRALFVHVRQGGRLDFSGVSEAKSRETLRVLRCVFLIHNIIGAMHLEFRRDSVLLRKVAEKVPW